MIDKAPEKDVRELSDLRMELVNRLDGCIADRSMLWAYDNELRVISKMPPERRKASFNHLVSKIRSQCRKAAKEAKRK